MNIVTSRPSKQLAGHDVDEQTGFRKYRSNVKKISMLEHIEEQAKRKEKFA
jgi:hypothetical protein